MAHPYNSIKEVRPGRRRAAKMSKGFKRGGKVHSDEAEDKALFGKLIKKHDADEMKVEGKKSGGRLDKFARGGRAKHKGHVHINIINAPKAGADPNSPTAGAGALAPLAAAGPPPSPGGGPPMPPPGMGGPPPGGPPPGMVPGMKRGGRAIPGESTKANLKDWAAYASKNSYQRGGAIKMKAGAESGVGRKELAAKQKKSYP